MFNRKDHMVLTVDERRRMAAMFAIFVRVDERNSKSAKGAKKSKSSKIKKARSPTWLRHGPSLLLKYFNLVKTKQPDYPLFSA